MAVDRCGGAAAGMFCGVIREALRAGAVGTRSGIESSISMTSGSESLSDISSTRACDILKKSDDL